MGTRTTRELKGAVAIRSTIWAISSADAARRLAISSPMSLSLGCWPSWLTCRSLRGSWRGGRRDTNGGQAWRRGRRGRRAGRRRGRAIRRGLGRRRRRRLEGRLLHEPLHVFDVERADEPQRVVVRLPRVVAVLGRALAADQQRVVHPGAIAQGERR